MASCNFPTPTSCAYFRVSAAIGSKLIRFSIPAVPAGATHICRYSIAAFSEAFSGLNLRFRSVEFLTGFELRIKIGMLIDLAASAVKLSSVAQGDQFVNRYLVTFSNYSNRDVQLYGLASCNSGQFGYTTRKDFPGGCNAPVVGAFCFFAPFSFSAGPIAAGQQASCEIETIGVKDPELGINRLQEQILSAQGSLLLDNNPSNDSLTLNQPGIVQVSTLTGLGIFAMIFGLFVGLRFAGLK
jgi:hypothetical protein